MNSRPRTEPSRAARCERTAARAWHAGVAEHSARRKHAIARGPRPQGWRHIDAAGRIGPALLAPPRRQTFQDYEAQLSESVGTGLILLSVTCALGWTLANIVSAVF
jgi:hypothetical protein